jgi:hypothetical protein
MISRRKKEFRFSYENSWEYKELHILPSLSVCIDPRANSGEFIGSWYSIRGSFLFWAFEISYS